MWRRANLGAHEWGHSTVKVTNEQYVIKELVLPSGQEIPWHRHATKHETHICVQGEGYVLLWRGSEAQLRDYSGEREKALRGDVIDMRPGRYCDVPPGVWHKVVSYTPLTILEPQGTNVEDIEWLSS